MLCNSAIDSRFVPWKHVESWAAQTQGIDALIDIQATVKILLLLSDQVNFTFLDGLILLSFTA